MEKVGWLAAPPNGLAKFCLKGASGMQEYGNKHHKEAIEKEEVLKT
jgi:hypothetical protein